MSRQHPPGGDRVTSHWERVLSGSPPEPIDRAVQHTAELGRRVTASREVFRRCSGSACDCHGMLPRTLWLALTLALLLMVGCGGISSGTPSARSSTPSSEVGGAALSADARSAATGDIPDTQNFLTLAASQAHFSMLYPEGWTVRESASLVSITDKNNLVRVAVSRGRAPSVSGVQGQMAALTRSTPGLHAGAATAISLKSGPAVKVTYTTQSPPNPVTGKQVTLMVDRYALASGGRVAVVDLGTPVGVDNVDAYRRMIESFRWR